ncbi:recombination endonuclease subunit [Synechococcus phage S-B05]|nr:recombination endonuclease subunit [Synechococcus phage S-B05]
MGDAFDSRKGIEFKSLKWAKRVVFNPLKDRGIKMHLMVGNHDAYYKNTNEINAVDLLLKEYDNVEVYSSPTEVSVGDLPILFLPWINEQNEKETNNIIKKTKCPVAMGHLELNGFVATPGHIMEHGHDARAFNKFRKVFSGHYHSRSDNGTVYYLGNPYEMFWNDVESPRGFTIFDTESLEHQSINNPHRLFYKIFYEDTDHQTFNTSEYENKIVKVIVRKKTDTKKFEKFIDKLYTSGVADLKIVENFQLDESEEFEAEESEDTMSILSRYIDESETELNKTVIQSLIKEIYQEACEVV